MSHIEKEKLIKADIASIENRVRHAFNQGYDLGYKEGKANRSEIPTGSIIDWNNCHTSEQLKSITTTKNYLGVDAVSRQAAIDAIRRIHPVDTDYDCTLYDKVDVMYVLKDLPSVTPQEPRWIPVNERLPKIAGVYRVTRYYPHNVMNPNYLVDACCFDGYNTWYNDNRINHESYANNVIAWQENPEPYKVDPQ